MSSSERPPLEEMTLRQLRRVASEYGVSRYSRMRKDQLLQAIQDIERTRFTPSPSRSLEAQEAVEAAKFDVGQIDRGGTLTVVDEGLADLPNGYGESRIVLMPRDPQWAYAYWDIPNDHKEAMRQQGGIRLALRFYDVTNIDLSYQRPHSLQQYECDELAREWYLPVPVSDRDYVVEIGYITTDGRWLLLARSASVRIPPIYPSDWIDDQFITVSWDEALQSKTFLELSHPTRQLATATAGLHDRVFDMAEAAEAQRVAGSVFGSMQQAPEESVSSYVFPSGVGKWASGAGVTGMSGAAVTGMSGVGVTGMSGVGVTGMSGVGMMSGVGLGVTGMSGVGMSGVGMYSMSGVGMSGIGMMGLPTMSGIGMSGVGMMSVPTMSGVGMMGLPTMSGIGMSGVGMYSMSGVGMSGIGMMGLPTMSGIGMSGVGMMSVPTMSGVGMSGVGMMGLPTMSGIGMSGVGMYSMSGIGMSGVGFSASMPPIRPRKFWLIADAELIVYGATEPDATVTIGGRPIKLNPDGTFRFQMAFPDGMIDFPIMAVAADGEQMRSIHMQFNRETPERRTNTRDEAVLEWLPE